MSQNWQFHHPNHGWLECKPCDAVSLVLDPDLRERYKIRLGEPMAEEFTNQEIEQVLSTIKLIRDTYPESQHRALHLSLNLIQRNLVSVALKLEFLHESKNGLAEE